MIQSWKWGEGETRIIQTKQGKTLNTTKKNFFRNEDNFKVKFTKLNLFKLNLLEGFSLTQ